MTSPDSAEVAYVPVPPKKIACGFYHTAAISNRKGQDLSAYTTPTLYSWGRNKNCVLGYQKPPGRRGRDGSESIPEAVFTPSHVKWLVDYSAKSKRFPYEVSAGTNHTAFLLKNPDEIGGELFCAGFGTRGRLGARNPNTISEPLEVEDDWNTEEEPLRTPFPSEQTRVLRVVCGADHTICLATDGALYSFGVNNEGQCGTGNTNDAYTPTRIQLDTNQRRVGHFAAGAQHSLAAIEGEVFCWGCGRNGRLGLGRGEGKHSPVLVTTLADYKVVFVACGEAHSGCIDEVGKALTWGAGSYGRLGHGEDMDVFVPKELQAFQNKPVKCMALGGFHSLFLAHSPSPSVSAAASFALHACGCGAAVGLLSEGDNSTISAPMSVHDPKVFGQTPVVQIAAGMFHNLVLMASGELITWGVGSSGRLGISDNAAKNKYEPTGLRPDNFRGFDSDKTLDRRGGMFDPSEIQARKAQRTQVGFEKSKKTKDDWSVKRISLGALHSMVLTDGGQLYVWGCNADFQLAQSHTAYEWVPRLLPINTGRIVIEIAAGYDHCLALTAQHELWAWGKGTSGQLGTGYARNDDQPKKLDTLSQAGQVLSIAAGEMHSGAIVRKERTELKLYMWGSAESGMLGIGQANMTGIRSLPELVTFPHEDAFRYDEAVGPLKVVCGQNHTAVLFGPADNLHNKGHGEFELRAKGNRIFTFGSGWFGKLGLNDDCNEYDPKCIDDLYISNPKDISVGAYHSAALSMDDDLYLWGKSKMCCEPASDFNVRTPKKFTQIEGQPKIRMVVCGEQYTLAVTRDGNELHVWGDNKNGQLCLGAQEGDDVALPVAVSSLSAAPVDFVAAGTGHGMAKLKNDEVYGWGNQSCGRLGLMEKKNDKICRDPEKVRDVWASIESRSKASDEKRVEILDGLSEDDDDEAAATAAAIADKRDPQGQTEGDNMTNLLNQQKVTQFSTMQLLIRQESAMCRDEQLQAFEEKLQKEFEDIVQSINNLPKQEKELDNLIGDISSSVKMNMKWLPKVGSLGAGESKENNPKVTEKLPVYKELLWVLQQQVSYLAQLSTCLQSDSKGEMAQVFYRVVHCIFGEDHERARHLFLALLRMMIDKETEQSDKKIEEVFHEDKSRAFHVFSSFALSERNYENVLHKLFKDTRQGKGRHEEGTETLVVEIWKCRNRNELFAMNIDQYVTQLGLDPKDQQIKTENMSEFQSNLERFKDFLTGPFLKSIEKVTLPNDIQQLLGHALRAVKARQFHKGENELDKGVSDELRVCGPLLRLFCDAIICKILDDPKAYINEETYLRQTFVSLSLKDDPSLLYNLKAVSEFLKMLQRENAFDSRQDKTLLSAAKFVKPELLKYIQKQADMDEKNLEVQLMMDAYLYHFERNRHPVTMATSDLLRLSNMLKLFLNKLRIRESDELEALCGQLDFWDDETIDSIAAQEQTDYQHNFLMKTRFLIYPKPLDIKELVICRATKVPMPDKLVGQKACEGLLMSFQAGEDSDNPRRNLEALFRDITEQIPETTTTFQALSEEFKKWQQINKQKSPPNYDMVQRLQDGLRMIEELDNVEAHPEDVLQFMQTSIEKRANFLKYLNAVKVGVEQINKKRKAYLANLEEMNAEYELARDFSLDLQLDQELIDQTTATELKFKTIADKMVSQRKVGLNPKEMQKLNCAILPIETITVSKLKKQGVLDEVHPKFKTMEKEMKITFKALNEGGVELVVHVVAKQAQNVVKTIVVNEQRLSEMRRAEKDDKVKLPKPEDDPEWFLIVVASKFCKQVTELSKKNAQ